MLGTPEVCPALLTRMPEALCLHEVQPFPPSTSLSKGCYVGQLGGPCNSQDWGARSTQWPWRTDGLLCTFRTSFLTSFSFLLFYSLPTICVIGFHIIFPTPFPPSPLKRQLPRFFSNVPTPTHVTPLAVNPTRLTLPCFEEPDWTPGLQI